MPGLKSPEVRAFAESVAAIEELRQVSASLGERGIPVMPLKGVLLQRLYYREPAQRRVTDIDVLVHPADFEPALQTLKNAGYGEVTASTPNHQVVLRRPGAILAVDLHSHLFEPSRYRMDSESVFARGKDDETSFGFLVRRMDERDLYAHLVGKVASDHLGWLRPDMLEDLRRVGAQAKQSAEAYAAHLCAMGAGRAGRYALGLVGRRGTDAFAEEVRACLPSDRVGGLIAQVGIRVTTRAPSSRMAKLSGLLLATSLRDSIRLGLGRISKSR